MVEEYLFLGFGLQILGALILTIVNTSRMWHGRYENLPFWKPRYWWIGRRPFYKNTETLKLKMNWNRKITIFGRMPPKHRWNWFAFLLILGGFFFQILALN